MTSCQSDLDLSKCHLDLAYVPWRLLCKISFHLIYHMTLEGLLSLAVYLTASNLSYQVSSARDVMVVSMAFARDAEAQSWLLVTVLLSLLRRDVELQILAQLMAIV